jgi:hypothetical protein
MISPRAKGAQMTTSCEAAMACTAAPFHPRRKNRKRMKQIDQITRGASHLSKCLRGLITAALLAGTIITASAAAQPPFIGALYGPYNSASSEYGVSQKEMEIQCGYPRTACDSIYIQQTEGNTLLWSDTSPTSNPHSWLLSDTTSGYNRFFRVKAAWDTGHTYETSYYLYYQDSPYSYCKYNTSTGVTIYNP